MRSSFIQRFASHATTRHLPLATATCHHHTFSMHASEYEIAFERFTTMWGQDALILSGLAEAKEIRAQATAPRLLDVACGAGKFALLAAHTGFHVTATDFSKEMIHVVEQKVAASGVDTIEAHVVDGQTLEGVADTTFDVVSSIFGITLFPDRMAAWRSALRVLKPGGQLIAAGWDATGANVRLFHYISTHALDKPGIQADAEVAAFIRPTNRTMAADSFAEELTEAGFSKVAIIPMTHDIASATGEAFVTEMLKNDALVAKKDRESVKLCVLHYIQLLADGVDPFAARAGDDVKSAVDPSEGRRAEDHALWRKPVVLTGKAFVAIAQKPAP